MKPSVPPTVISPMVSPASVMLPFASGEVAANSRIIEPAARARGKNAPPRAPGAATATAA